MKSRHLLLCTAASFAPALLFCGPAAAQSTSLDNPGIRSPVDEHGVDLSTGEVVIPSAGVSIGGANGLTHTRTRVANGWRHNYLISLEFTSGDTVASVNMGGSRMTFSRLGTSPTYVSRQGTGETITADFTSGTHVLTLRDGTEVTFKESYVTAGQSYYGAADALGETIVRPNGHSTELHYESDYYEIFVGYWLSIYVVRLGSVTTNTGYQLKYEYESPSNPAQTDDWYEISKVTAINNAVEFCSRTGGGCSLSDSWPTVTYSTTASGNDTVESVSNALNETIEYRIDSSDRLKAVKRPENVATGGPDSIVFNYTSDDRVSTVVYQGSYTRNYLWTDTISGDVQASSTDSVGRSQTTITDPVQRVVLSRRNGSPLNEETKFEYDVDGRIEAIEAPEGNRIEYDYDIRGNLIQTKLVDKSNPSNTITTSSTFVSSCSNPVTCNLPTSTTDANGNVTNYLWDASHGGLLRMEAPSPAPGDPRPTHQVSYANKRARYYDAPGVLSTGGLIAVPTATYQCRDASLCFGDVDELRTLLYYTDNLSAGHNLNTRQVTTMAGNGSTGVTSFFTYTNLGKLASVEGNISGSGDTTTFIYDDIGRVLGVISPDPDGSGPLRHLATRTTYNSDGRVTKTERGFSIGVSAANLASMDVEQVFETSYDSFGRIETTSQVSTDGATRYSLSQFGYDNAGRLECTAIRMNVTSTSTPLPDACVAMTATSGNEDRITRRHYDVADRITELWSAYDTSIAQQSAEMSYNANGTLAWVEDANDSRTTYTYDGFDRRTRAAYPNPSAPNVSSTSDREDYTYDDAGNVLTFRTRSGETFYYDYDSLNRLTLKNVPTRSGLSTTHTRDVYYDYDLWGGLLEARFDNGNFGTSGDRVSFDLDALGRPKSTTQNMNGTSRNIAYQYDAGGRRTRITHPDGAYWTYEYDLLNRLTGLRDDGNVSLVARGFDNYGRLTSVSRDLSAPDETVYYDAAGRYDRVFTNHPNSAYDVNRRYTWNQAGQVNDERVDNQLYVWDGQPNGNQDTVYSVDGLNQYDSVNGVSFAYDSGGNLVSDGTTNYQYDTENRLVKATGGNSAELRYDPLGRLFEIQDAGTSVERFLYDGQDLVSEYDGSGAMLDRYVHGVSDGDDPLVAYPSNNSSHTVAEHLYTDRVGSVAASFNRSGTVKAINTYDEFGVPGQPSGSANKGRFRYTGQAFIPELGQYHYKARAYSPTLGRFMQTDPIGYSDGMNMYSYVGNDPLNRVDPTGTEFVCVFPAPSNPQGSKEECEAAGGQWVKSIVVTATLGDDSFSAYGWTISIGGLGAGSFPIVQGGVRVGTVTIVAPDADRGDGLSPNYRYGPCPASRVYTVGVDLDAYFLGGVSFEGGFAFDLNGAVDFYGSAGGGVGVDLGATLKGGSYDSWEALEGVSESIMGGAGVHLGYVVDEDGNTIGYTAALGPDAGLNLSRSTTGTAGVRGQAECIYQR